MSETKSRRAFFAAANSGEGFVSMFEEIFFGENIKRRYIIKGGPGTGKSSFMKKVGAFAERQGADVEYYYCSSDTASIDGLVINGEIAMLDGTAPHSYDTVAPGYVDSIIDLGVFWSEQRLSDNKAELINLSERKKRAYSRGYCYLSAVLKTDFAADRLILPCVKTDKMISAAARDIARLGLKGKGKVVTRQTSAFGTAGEVYLPTYTDSAARVYYVEDICGVSALYLGELELLAKKMGYEAMVSYDTFNRGKVKEIFFPETSDCFTSMAQPTSDESAKINTKRFLDVVAFSEVRRLYRATVQCRDRLKQLAEESLAEAGSVHAEMEGYYVSAMDFSGLEKYCQEFIDKLSAL